MAVRRGLAIRSADAEDAAGVTELLGSAGIALEPRGLASRLSAGIPSSGAVLIADEWGPPSGVIALSWYWTLIEEAKTARVTLLLVDPGQRRRGLARLLLKAASQAARTAGCGELQLIAPDAARDLQAFCRATGFSGSGSALTRPLRKRV